jgi:acetolactate synthase I/II/III large subunit
MKGSEAFIESMIKNGTNVTFGYPGGKVIPLFDSFLNYQDKIKNILVRHEQGAAHAAEGFAKASGKTGVCIATSGPGATNLVTGIMDALMDSVPIIAVGGQVETKLIGNDAFQESDMVGITAPITKHNFQVVSPNQIPSVVSKAYLLSQTGRQGPVYIDLPSDTQMGECTKEILDKVNITSYNPTIKGNPAQIKKAAEMILKAERPLVIAGGGVINSNASKELLKVIELLKIPIATTLMGKGSIDERHPLCLGLVGMHGRKVANYATIEADIIVAVGCRFSDRVTGNPKTYAENAKIIHIDVDPAEIGKNVGVALPIVGDAKSVLSDLELTLKHYISKELSGSKANYSEWTKSMKEYVKECNCCIDNKSSPINPVKVIYELQNVLKDDDIVSTGVGQHQMYAMHFLKLKNPRTFITSGGAGTMGVGLPFAIGAKVAKPKSNVFDIDGDGSFQMTIQELGTCKDSGIKVIPIIFRNNYLGMVRQWLELFKNKRYSQVNLPKTYPDFVKISEGYGLKATKITRHSEISDAFKTAIKDPETHVIEIDIEEESNVLPMLPPGGNLKEAFGGCMIDSGKFFKN